MTEILEYTSQISCWRRVAQIQEPFEGGFDGKEYWKNKILKYDVLKECWAAETEVGFVGQDLFDVLATRRDEDPSSEKYQKAEKVVWRLLTSTCMQKVTHGKNLLRTPALGTLWDLTENEGKDVEEGTFAELLRYGSLHFQQTREEIEKVEPEETGFVIRKGLLEA